MNIFPHPLSLSVSQLISLDPEVCNKWFLFFCLKGKSYFMQKKFLFLGHPCDWQPCGSLGSRHSWPRTENPGQSTEAICAHIHRGAASHSLGSCYQLPQSCPVASDRCPTSLQQCHSPLPLGDNRPFFGLFVQIQC